MPRPARMEIVMAVAASQPEVRTAVGVVRGTREAGLAVFRGIPFAEPPVGALRFAAPRPVRGWAGVRDAVSYGPPPPQAGVFGMTINVWSLDPGPGAGLPVLVWIQGDAYVIGTSGLPEYDGGRLTREGAVVVVTFTYRVGNRGVRADRGSARQPRSARPGRRPGVGARQHPGFRRQARPGHGLRRVGGWRIGRRTAGEAACDRALPPGRRAERAGYVLHGRARRRHRRHLRRRAGAAAHGGRPLHCGPVALARRR